MHRHFNEHYRELVSLRDGTRAVLRLVRPDDKALLRAGFEHLSPRSRYYRFFTPKPRLSDDEVRYLTEVDGENHFAMGAVTDPPDGEPEGLGIARFIRLREAPEVAEAAFTVADHAQGKGLGTLLFRRLSAAARERGITRFRCLVIATNAAMSELFHAIAPDAPRHIEQGVATVELALTSD